MKYQVEVCRTGFGFATIDVDALALDEAGNHSFNEKLSEYSLCSESSTGKDSFTVELFKLLTAPNLDLTIGNYEIDTIHDVDGGSEDTTLFRCECAGGEFEWYFANQLVTIVDGRCAAITASGDWGSDATPVSLTLLVSRPIVESDLNDLGDVDNEHPISAAPDLTTKYTQFSIDGGQTWQNINNDVRFVFREASEDDDELQDLHIVVTDEGGIADLVGQKSGNVVKTASLPLEFLVGLTE